MENYDPEKEAQVWRRVQGQQAAPRLNRAHREQLRRCHRRLAENLRLFESLPRGQVYDEAFAHLARQTREQMATLHRMLGR